MSEQIETVNDQLVSVDGAGDILVMSPKYRMSKKDALRHAAWLVVLAAESDGDFERVLEAVKST